MFLYVFMFQLTKKEFENLRSQIVTSNWGGRRHLPYAFTEQGVAMLSSVLNSKRAIQVNIGIMRIFVNIRRLVSANKYLFAETNLLMLTNIRIMPIFTCIALLLLRTLESIATPCSVKA